MAEPLITRNPIEQAIVVPSTKKADKPISKKAMQKRVDEVRKFLSKNYGGYTSVRGVGGWVEGKRVIKERNVTVTSFASKKDYEKHKKALRNKIFTLGKKWGQMSMAYEKEGDLYFYNIGEWEKEKQKERKKKLKNKMKGKRKVKRRKRK